MAFGDVKTPKGLNELNDYLVDNSYINGYNPSKADVTVFESLGKLPTGNTFSVQRWYRQIASYSAQERSAWGGSATPAAKAAPAAAAAKAEDDDDVDLFGSDDEGDAAESDRIRDERVKAYADKKSKKPALIAKSSIILDVKPWSDETDMKIMESNVRSINMDGLLWGASKLVPVGYGIKKLQICCVIEDDKVSTDLLSEQIEAFEEVVQSVDIAAFNKV